MQVGSEKALKDTGGVHLLQHADRCWKAQEANAARLATRANLVLSAVTAIIGLTVFVLGREIDSALRHQSHRTLWLLVGMGVVGLFSAIVALLKVLGVRWDRPSQFLAPRKDRSGPASAGLALDPRVVSNPWSLTESEAVWYLFGITYTAAQALEKMNSEKQRSLKLAQKWLIFAVILLVLSTIFYTVSGAGRVSLPATNPVPAAPGSP